MSAAGDQGVFAFGHAPGYGPDFLPSPSNAEARAWLQRGKDWPQGRLAIWGEGGRGKTHLLRLWAGKLGAEVAPGATLSLRLPFGAADGPLAIDDADQAPERELLHLLNAAAERKNIVLLAAREAPARWDVTLPDLASRLKAITAVEIREPEEDLLRALLVRMFAERQMVVAEAVQDFLLLRLPRHPAALHEAAARLDRASLLAGRAPSRVLAKAVIDEMSAREVVV